MKTSAQLVLAAAATLVAVAPAFANATSNGNHFTRSGRNEHYQPYNSAFEFPNCLAYNSSLREYVWICGSPYPPEVPHS